MTIRTRLLIVLPLLVILMNAVAFFLFQSASRVQSSYDLTMKRVLLYQETVSASDASLKGLYALLLSPPNSSVPVYFGSDALTAKRDELAETNAVASGAPIFIGFLNLTETLADQEQRAYRLARSGDNETALTAYLEAEKTAGFIRSEAQRLTDAELGYFQPIYEQVRRESRRLFGFGIASFALGTLLTVSLALTLSRSVTEPVNELMVAAERVSEGELDIALPERRTNDELGSLYQSIRRMLLELRRSTEQSRELHEKEQLVQTLELQTLRSQIQPHFLFNTLNVLSKLALLEQAEQTSGLIVSLSNLLRYNLQTLDRPVTVRDEIKQVRDYIAIQKARFRDRIRFELDFDEAVLDRAMPSLIMQPLVENACSHGVADLEQGAVISVSAGQDEAGNAVLTVSDNGKGMAEETRLALLNPESPDPLPSRPSTGLGTRNVFRRLALVYNRRDLVAIESAPGRGTRIQLTIPAPSITGKEDADVPDPARR
ncbi:histidine kinase [Gorillibacterium sp. sgz500922]|uniref:sensor histidine kinase n=1 Tax=Gorillibacterium sp. sgz500922 TaxID=3446694 RepID=UPI003F677B44